MWVEEASTVDISNITRFFTNQQYDKESGLYYYNARYYDPHLGSFITPDPVMDGLNHYVYCSANPIRYTDPTGLSVKNNSGNFILIVNIDKTILGEEKYTVEILANKETFKDPFDFVVAPDGTIIKVSDSGILGSVNITVEKNNNKIDFKFNTEKDKKRNDNFDKQKEKEGKRTDYSSVRKSYNLKDVNDKTKDKDQRSVAKSVTKVISETIGKEIIKPDKTLDVPKIKEKYDEERKKDEKEDSKEDSKEDDKNIIGY